MRALQSAMYAVVRNDMLSAFYLYIFAVFLILMTNFIRQIMILFPRVTLNTHLFQSQD